MLQIQTRTKRRAYISTTLAILAVIVFIAGLYVLSLVFAPAIAPMISQKPIDVKKLPVPSAKDNRIIIPKIGVNIPYGKGSAALTAGAEWRQPERGNPEKGGNFIIAAHRLTIQPTPGATIEKSPFYNIDKLAIGDKIIIDRSGTRYGYNIGKIFNVTPNQVEIEAPSEAPELTLYSCDITGAATGRVVIIAEPMGKVALNGNQQAE